MDMARLVLLVQNIIQKYVKIILIVTVGKSIIKSFRVVMIVAKSELTVKIEKALKYYAPTKIGGIKLNVFRGRTTAFEVPAECGTTKYGMIDCVRINEYFDNINKKRGCVYCTYEKALEDYVNKQSCIMGLTFSEKPSECNQISCRNNIPIERGEPGILITCYEIKVTKADFKSKNGHNFVGNLNFYVIPKEIYSDVADMIPAGIGEFRELTDSEQKWLLMSVMKRIRFGKEGND
jgi:hypothetical protein